MNSLHGLGIYDDPTTKRRDMSASALPEIKFYESMMFFR